MHKPSICFLLVVYGTARADVVGEQEHVMCFLQRSMNQNKAQIKHGSNLFFKEKDPILEGANESQALGKNGTFTTATPQVMREPLEIMWKKTAALGVPVLDTDPTSRGIRMELHLPMRLQELLRQSLGSIEMFTKRLRDEMCAVVNLLPDRLVVLDVRGESLEEHRPIHGILHENVSTINETIIDFDVLPQRFTNDISPMETIHVWQEQLADLKSQLMQGSLNKALRGATLETGPIFPSLPNPSPTSMRSGFEPTVCHLQSTVMVVLCVLLARTGA